MGLYGPPEMHENPAAVRRQSQEALQALLGAWARRRSPRMGAGVPVGGEERDGHRGRRPGAAEAKASTEDWSWPSAEGGCREDGAEESSGCGRSPEGEEGSPSSQASAWSWASSGVEEEGGLMARTEEPLTQLATRIPKELHRRLKLYCVTREIDVQDFVTEAIEEKLGRKTRLKKGPA